MRQKVEDNPDLVRDTNTNALLNTSLSSLENYKKRKRRQKEIDRALEEINSMIEIGIIGFGSLGKQIKTILDEDAKREITYYFFDDILASEKNEYKNVFPFNAYRYCKKDLYYIVAIGYKHLKFKKKMVLFNMYI